MTTNTEPQSQNCCSVPDSAAAADDGTVAFEELRGEEIPADVAAIRSTGFKLLLDTGNPVTVEDLIDATGIPAARVAEIFDAVRVRGRVEFDDQDRIIGLAGLTLVPTRHQLTIGGSIRWSWCALDAVGILGALRATGTVKSSDPHTGDEIEIGFVEGKAETEAHLFILGGYTEEGNVRQNWCSRVNFFISRRAAEEWVADNGLEGDIIAVSDISDDAAAMWQPVVDLAAPQVC